MPKPNKLTAKQKAFVREYLICRNGAEAARKAGYSKNRAEVEAHRLLTNADIQALISKNDERLQKKCEITQERIIEELATIAFGNIGNVMDWTEDSATLIPKEEMSERDQKYIESIQFTEVKGDSGLITSSFKLKTMSAHKAFALERLGKHLGMWKDGNGSGTNRDARKAALERIRGYLKKRAGEGR